MLLPRHVMPNASFRTGDHEKFLYTFFHIHEATDAHDWLVLRGTIPSLPWLLHMDDFGIVRIQTCNEE